MSVQMTDVVNAYLGQAAQLVKVGGSLTMGLIDDLIPDVVTIRWLDGADEETILRAAGDPAAVLALDLSPEGELAGAFIAMLANRPSGARTLLLSAHPAAALPAKELADQLSRSGHRCVHVVALDLDSGTTLRAVIGIQAVGGGLVALEDNQKVLDAAVAGAQPVPASLDDVEALKAVVVTVSERAAVESHARAVAEAALMQTRADLATARQQLRALRSSAAMQIGRGLVEVVQHPVAGLPRLPGRLRAATRARSSAKTSVANLAALTTPPAPTLPPGATSTGRVLPVPSRRRRTFPLALPSCDSTVPGPHALTTPRDRVDIDVPYPFFIPLRLQREGLAGYEPESVAWWLALCDLAGPGEVWDVGANTGLYAMLTRALTDRDVVAFEPTPDLAAWARRIGFVNDIAFPVEQVALADADGTATFFLSDSTDSSSSLAEGFRESSHQLQVLTERMDSFASRRRHGPAVIKIDVETTEPAVLRGGLETLREHRPWILCEVLSGCGVEQPVMDLTGQLGYSWYHITEEMPPRLVDKIVGDPDFTYFMYLLAPRHIDDALVHRARGWRSGLERCLPLTPPT
jgi:FkbM family methyltransferase